MTKSKRLAGLVRAFAAHVLPPAIALAALLAAWELYVDWRNVPTIVVPAPSAVVQRFFEDPGYFWRQGWYTLYEATLGLLIGSAFAVALAVLMAHSRLAERTMFPLAIIMKVTPLVAIAPVLVIVLGFGTTPKIVIAALFCFFPMLANPTTGFRDVNPRALEFMRSLSASPWQVFWKLRLPSSLPYLFAALRVAYPLALVGAVVAEWFTGDTGLGRVIYASQADLKMPTLFAAVGVLVIMGVTINAALSLVERRLLFWHASIRSTQ